MDLTLKQRIMALIEHHGVTIASFERMCGMCNGYVRNINDSIGTDKLESILRVFPNTNLLWLVSGIGNMLNDSENSTSQNQNFVNNNKSFNNFSNSSFSEISILREELKKKNEQIDRMIKLLEYIVYQGGTSEFPSIKTSPESRQK